MKYKGYIIYTTVIRTISDFFVLYLSFLLAFWFRFHAGVFAVELGIPSIENYLEAFFIAVIILLLVFKSFGLYNEKKILRFSSEFSLIVKALSMGVIVIMALTFAHRAYSYSRLLVALSWGISVLSLTVSRYFINDLEKWLCNMRQEQKKILILGTGETALSLFKNIRKNPRWGYEIIGFLSRHEDRRENIEGVPVLGDISRLEEVLDKKRPDEVILAITGLSHEKMVELIVESEKRMILFKLIPDMFEIITSKVDIFDIDGIPLLGLKELPLEYAWNRFVKRIFDIAGSVFGLILSIPIYIVIPVIIKMSSRGPVFYKQVRCGEDGKTFTLYKFRTMHCNAEQNTGPVWAEEHDPRCTWIGKWLRQLYIDEIPQLYNVLKGDMSLVGPRPERPNFVEQFKEDIPRYMSRHFIKSGMTGWAQVNGLRGNTPLKERIKYDMYYIENWSVWFDIKIIFMTIFLKNKIKPPVYGDI